MIKEREPMPKGVPPYIYPSIHTLAPFDRDCMTCFFIDPFFDFTTYGMQVWILSYPTLSSTKALPLVGKTEGSYCPSEDSKS
jgi:hypothetical protein